VSGPRGSTSLYCARADMMSDKSGVASLETVQQLYDDNRFLDAFRESAEYWKPSTAIQNLSVDELILGGRLAARLGGGRLSRRLLRTAYAREPDNPRVRYFTIHIRRSRSRVLDDLRAFEENPDFCADDPEMQAAWLASYAVTWAFLRDFTSAHHCLERAVNLQSRDAWVTACESDVLGLEDRWPEALQRAEFAWEISPGSPFAASSLSTSLLNVGRFGEAVQRLAAASGNCQSYEVVRLASWSQCALAETLDGERRSAALDCARKLAERLSALAPLADWDTRRSLARSSLDIASLADDHDEMEHWAEKVRIPFFRQVVNNLRTNPEGRRIRLPYRRALQKREACLPTSLSSALATLGESLDADVMASEITFGGTYEWAAAEWLEKRGFAVRFFAVTPEIATALILNGIGFVLMLEADDNAHAVAVVGLDAGAGTLLVHDPSAYRTVEFLLESFAKHREPLGIKGMVAVPAEKVALLEQVLPENDVAIATASVMYMKALALRGPTAGREVVLRIAEKLPSHPGTRLLKAAQAAEDSRTGEALIGFQQLSNDFPHSPSLRLLLVGACRLQGNTALMREMLAGVVERGVLPGVQSQQDWRYPPARYVSEYAHLLHQSAETRQQAGSMLHALLRRQPRSADGWYALGGLLWKEAEKGGALLSFRIASSLASGNEHYALTYANALAQSNREEEGFRWLESRVRNFGKSLRAARTWITWISMLEEWGQPERALTAAAEALGQHENSPELLGFVIPFLARMGQWEEAENLLRRLEEVGNLPLFHEAAVGFHRQRGNLQKSNEHAEAWVREVPGRMPARYALVDLIARRDGAGRAFALASQWREEHPGNDGIEELYYRQLDRAGEPKRKKYFVLFRRLKRNREDASAWRELALCCMEDYERGSEKRRARLQPRVISTIAQCDRTAPEDAATIRVHARWHEVCARWPEAVAGWLDSIDRDPGTFYGYQRIWDCSCGFAAEGRREVWEKLEPILLRAPGHLTIARNTVQLLAERFGVSAAEDAVSRWKKVRPDDPEITQAFADLLLERGQGRTDGKRAYAMLLPAVEHFPHHFGLRFSLVSACRKLGKLAEAEEALEEIIRRHPDNTWARIQLAWVHELRGNRDETDRLLREATASDPQNTQISDALVQIMIRHDAFEQARSTIATILDRSPRDVYWRERAIRLFLDCNDEEGAVESARAGVRVYPRSAYLWSLLGSTLNRLRRFAEPGEIEFCFRKSLALNPLQFEAADHLACLLAEQRRYHDAGQVMLDIAPRMYDSSSARGRLAWIHRMGDRKQDAREEMTATVRDFPWYQWGWNLLVDWLVEDQAWEQVRALLGTVPEELRTEPRVRKQRLVALEKAGLPADVLDKEWSLLLADFPDQIALHLHRYDLLREARRLPEAQIVLNSVQPPEPDNPLYLARLVEVRVREKKDDEAIALLQKIFFAGTKSTNWPEDYAWGAIRQAQLADRAYATAVESLGRKRPTPRAFFIVCSHALEKGKSVRVTSQRLWTTWFPDAGVKELLHLLDMADHSPWIEGAYRAVVLDRLSSVGHYRLVIRYWRKHKGEVEGDSRTWSETARALASLKRSTQTRRLLSSWRSRSGVGMWVVATYVTSLSMLRPSRLKEIVAACGDALRDLPHDHCARFLAHARAEASALLGDKATFLQTWNQYRSYFDCQENSKEWFPAGRRYLLAEIPMAVRFLQQNRTVLYHKMIWGWRWKRIYRLRSRRLAIGDAFTIPWWVLWLLIWIAIQVFLRNV
jgi:predicted Zn-dependent protease